MRASQGEPTSRVTHLLCFATLLLTGIVLSLPLMGSGFMYYVDNAVHLAELQSLAFEGGWSELNFCGFPLSLLHSPLWYGLLAVLVSAGVSSVFVYCGALYVGLVGRWIRGRTSQFFPSWENLA